ncbi:MAG: 1-acyl-sn-glycerol-3-phosphate acyltransferase, partial [Clostridia bacterium]|nr:1-acyl-sn-glycerol-3-phosphate acyltransferase [Clostridia bacterium]
MANNTKKNTWIKPRHRRWWNFANWLLKPIIRCKYHMEIVPFEDNKGQYLVLCNHQTPFDQFYLSKMFKGNIYFVCTEDLLSNKLVGGIIKHTIEPIPIQKGAMDLGTIKACARVAKEGGSIIVYPEGNRTYSGKTGHIKPAVAKLAKFLKLPIALVRQEGGFGIEPCWSNVSRDGKARIAVSKVLTHDEYKTLTDDQLYQLICQELFVDDSASDATFKHKRRA